MTIAFSRFIAVLFVILSVLAAPPVRADVTLKGLAEINHAAVRLSDVFDGLPTGLDCDIAQAPAPGKTSTYNVNTLSYLARQYKLDWHPTSLADHAVIRTASTKISTDALRQAVIAKLKEQDVKGSTDVSFDNRNLEVQLPADRGSNFVLNDFQYDAVNKRFSSTFTAEGDNGPITLPVVGHVVIKRQIPVLAHRLEAGTVVSANDLDWIDVPEDRLTGVITNADQMVGRELRRDTDEEQPLHEHDVVPPRYVVRGTLVTMKIEMPLLVITAQGRALQDGAMGEIVRVNNTDSNRMIEGVVTGPGVVTVRGTQKFAAAIE